MNQTARYPTRRRRGSVLQEATMAIALAAAAMLGMTQLLAFIAQERRASRQQVVAAREVANLMEQAMALTPAQLADRAAAGLQISAGAQAALRQSRLQYDMQPEADRANLVRIHIALDWENAPGRRVAPIRLVAWRYVPERTKP